MSKDATKLLNAPLDSGLNFPRPILDRQIRGVGYCASFFIIFGTLFGVKGRGVALARAGP
jgi:hypothetical protein